jgi:hypothetical protein
MTRLPIAATALLLTSTVPAGEAQQTRTDDWEAVKRAVARRSASSHSLDFPTSLLLWAQPKGFPPGEPAGIVIEGDLDQTLDAGLARIVHVHGNLSAALTVGANSEVVIGGSITKDARLEAKGIAQIYVHGDLIGEVGAWSMTSLSVGGDFRGKLETGHPTLWLHVAGNFTGTVTPMVSTRPGMLMMDIEGHASEIVLKAIDKWNYAKLHIAVATSDLGLGVHPLWLDKEPRSARSSDSSASGLLRARGPWSGFVAVTGGRRSGSNVEAPTAVEPSSP